MTPVLGGIEMKYDELAHYGVLGMKWGVRRYQNKDGSRTSLGKAHRREQTVFLSGSSKTEFRDSPYYRRQLPKAVRGKIKEYTSKGYKIVVGDAPGVDRQVQRYLNKQGYQNVQIFSPGTKNRFLANKAWKTKLVDAPEYEEGSKEWLAKKDILMTEISDIGLAVVLDEGAAATRRNVKRLAEQNKPVSVFVLSKNSKTDDHFLNQEMIDALIESVD